MSFRVSLVYDGDAKYCCCFLCLVSHELLLLSHACLDPLPLTLLISVQRRWRAGGKEGEGRVGRGRKGLVCRRPATVNMRAGGDNDLPLATFKQERRYTDDIAALPNLVTLFWPLLSPTERRWVPLAPLLECRKERLVYVHLDPRLGYGRHHKEHRQSAILHVRRQSALTLLSLGSVAVGHPLGVLETCTDGL